MKAGNSKQKWINVIFQSACLNFALFFAVALHLGGSAALSLRETPQRAFLQFGS
jgi:hypothetical protein